MPFQIVRNDITKMHVDAIVNTANPMPGYGPGIDTAVYEAAGADKLLARRKEIGMIDRGCSVITDGYDLPAKYIIHTVGTGWRGGEQGEEDPHCRRQQSGQDDRRQRQRVCPDPVLFAVSAGDQGRNGDIHGAIHI